MNSKNIKIIKIVSKIFEKFHIWSFFVFQLLNLSILIKNKKALEILKSSKIMNSNKLKLFSPVVSGNFSKNVSKQSFKSRKIEPLAKV